MNGLYAYENGKPIIRIISGALVDVTCPKAVKEHCTPEVIAHALAHMPRWGGHTPTFYSVAQHSMAVAVLVDPRHKLCALLHDASEAFLMDLPRPVKQLLPEYQKLETTVMQNIADAYGFEWPMPEEVKNADEMVLQQEWEAINGAGRFSMVPKDFSTVKVDFLAQLEKARRFQTVPK